MKKQYKSKKIEEKIYKFWEKNSFFNPDKLLTKSKKYYSIVLPPPNITGSLHIGHALNAVIQDIIIRWKRMKGFQTIWSPGIDHAGIATQNVVEKYLRKQGKTRFDLGKKQFIREIWKWKKKSGNAILKQLKKIGCSCDWSRTRFTMDSDYAKAVQKAFLHYYKKGMIYQSKRTINWCPKCQTSLSDLEIEYREEKSKLWFIKYRFAKEKNKYIIIATTRPETMLGDTAVAVHPNDKRYKNKITQKVILPLVHREIPIVADKIVDPKFGTGAVKVTPAHSFIDYQIAQKHKLEIIQVIDEKRKINKNGPVFYQGLKTEEAREKIIKDLEKENLIEKTIDYIHKIPQCYRCNSTIEILLSKQWFVKMDKLAKLAIEPIKQEKVKFHPKRWKKTYLDWLENTFDWCISRQLWWGHKIPVWHCQNKKDRYFVSIKKPKKCLICKKCKPKPSEDVLDTWFSSALWPFAVFGWPQKTNDLKRFYPTNVLSTARDIINLWVARMVFSSMEFNKKIPFEDVIIHPTVLTKEGKRMSKSLGTGIDPIDLIEKYGADALRFGLSWELTGLQDIRFSENNIIAGKKFCNKLWNASRFVLQQIGKEEIKMEKKPNPITNEDKKILKEFDKIIKSTDNNLLKFRFAKSVQGIYHFFWHKFCDIYIEKSKNQIREPKSFKELENTKQILIYVLANSLKLLHPFIPFITEEIYQILPIKNKQAIIVEKWPNTKI